jgi:hypothetical protein
MPTLPCRLAQGDVSGQLDNYALVGGLDMDTVRQAALVAQTMEKEVRHVAAIVKMLCLLLELVQTTFFDVLDTLAAGREKGGPRT